MNKTCTLEQAKRLKELGVEQKSTQWYANVNYDHPPRVNNKEDFAAFDTDELLAMLPPGVHVGNSYPDWNAVAFVDCVSSKGQYVCKYMSIHGPSYAVALAEFVIKNLENGCLQVAAINGRIKQYNEG